jgi:uncharacterized protein YjbI with pentapeptide repeats
MKTIKPQRLGLLTKVFEHHNNCYFVASILVFFPFEEPSALLPEVKLWQLVAAELGRDAALDMAMPKPRAELLVAGRAYALGGKPRIACAARVKLGSVDKTLYVVGDRSWKLGGASAPEPFTEMPITYERAFGGAGYAQNPLGKGYVKVETEGGGEVHPLPNIEDPKHAIASPGDRPEPAGFGPYDLTWPQRFSKAGTYDQKWLKERFPGLADDTDLGLFNAAPRDQHLAEFPRGDEAFSVENMHPEMPLIESRLPGVKVRCFINQRTAAGKELREIHTRIDTVHLLPHVRRGILIFRGVVPIAEDDGDDVLQIILGAEEMGSPRPVEHYRTVLEQRLDKKRGALLALRDSDLMPPRREPSAPLADDLPSDMDALVAAEGLLQKNMRRRLELEFERARETVAGLGLDPAEHVPPMPPEEQAPDMEKLGELVEKITEQIEQAQADTRSKLAKADEDARAACVKAGLDYEKVKRDARAEAGGPPKFSARKELEKLRGLKEHAATAGRLSSEADAALSDPEVERKLVLVEQQLFDAYRRFAHHYPEAASLTGDEGTRLREEVIAAHAAGQSLAGRDLTGVDLSGLDLRGVDLRGALLEAASFVGSTLTGANLEGAVLARADLSDTILEGARLAGANLGQARLRGAQITGGVDLTGATLASADLSSANLRGARMDGADLFEAQFADTDFSAVKASGLIFIQNDLSGLALSGAELVKCNFIEVDLSGVDFSGATLTSSVFVSVKADNAVLRGCKLGNLRVVKDSSFEGADFVGALLEGANLRGTNLGGCDLSGANLDGADLSECDLRGAKLYRASAKGALFIRTDLSQAVLTGANLMHAILQKAKVHGADLRGANLFRADLARVEGDNDTTLEGALVTQVRTVATTKRPHAQG